MFCCVIWVVSEKPDLGSIPVKTQERLWKSVVRVSSEEATVGTAIVVDATDEHLYLLTNLHLWATEEPGTFEPHLNHKFSAALKKYRAKNNMTAYKQSKGDKNVDRPDIVVERLVELQLTQELSFKLCPEVCWD